MTAILEAAPRRCRIDELFTTSFIELLRLAPKNPLVRSLVLSLTRKMPPDACRTYDEVKDWVEQNCEKRARPSGGSSDGFSINVQFEDREYGRASYSVTRYGSEPFCFEAGVLEDVARAAVEDGANLDVLVSRLSSQIKEDAWEQCSPCMDDYGDYDYGDHESARYGMPKCRVLQAGVASAHRRIPAGASPGSTGGTDMKLTKVGVSELVQTREVAGLLSCRVDYEVKSGKGRLNYTGPKFSREMWHQVLSFFRWTHETMDSESQVRLYVNTKLGRWGAWAFPQEARTGMSAREIAVQESPEKAIERFAFWESEPSDDWVYFCTVHHHCSASAFQSGTDEDNERNQDGLHITVGHMHSERHDLHARFYLDSNCFDPDMSLFWPLDPDLIERLPSTVLDELARFQMCENITMAFPEVWQENVIEAKRDLKSRKSDHHAFWPGDSFDIFGSERLREAIADLDRGCRMNGFSDERLVVALQNMIGNSIENVIMEVCLDYRITPEDLMTEISQLSF